MHPLKNILRHYKQINKMIIRRNIFQLFQKIYVYIYNKKTIKILFRFLVCDVRRLCDNVFSTELKKPTLKMRKAVQEISSNKK